MKRWQFASDHAMYLDKNMAETVVPEMPSPAAIDGCVWLPEGEPRVYRQTNQQTGFQGGLNWYCCRFVDDFTCELQILSRRTVDVPAMFISGKSDRDRYQGPGTLEKMASSLYQFVVQRRDLHQLYRSNYLLVTDT